MQGRRTRKGEEELEQGGKEGPAVLSVRRARARRAPPRARHWLSVAGFDSGKTSLSSEEFLNWRSRGSEPGGGCGRRMSGPGPGPAQQRPQGKKEEQTTNR